MVQGDLFDIQDFIFAIGGPMQKYAARLLRGRSFYMNLLAERAALRILDALALPPTSRLSMSPASSGLWHPTRSVPGTSCKRCSALWLNSA